MRKPEQEIPRVKEPVKECPECREISPFAARSCESCGHAFKMPKGSRMAETAEPQIARKDSRSLVYVTIAAVAILAGLWLWDMMNHTGAERPGPATTSAREQLRVDMTPNEMYQVLGIPFRIGSAKPTVPLAKNGTWHYALPDGWIHIQFVNNHAVTITVEGIVKSMASYPPQQRAWAESHGRRWGDE